MKESVRALLGQAGRYRPVRTLYRVMSFVAKCLAEPGIQAARLRLSSEDAAYAKRLSPTLTVLNGPFKGMQYPSASSAGSTLAPKILGSYERELHGVIDRILKNDYSDIVDVGSAEGYYAVGLGRHFPKATVHAFDTSPRARRLCADMARNNGISDRLRLNCHCNETTLVGLALGRKALIISDCEGYEAQLFTPRVAAFLAPHDILIEVHDTQDPEISRTLQSRFKTTHDVTVVDSIDDKHKLREWSVPELTAYDSKTKHRLVSEGRAGAMEWLFFTPKHSVAARCAASVSSLVTSE